MPLHHHACVITTRAAQEEGTSRSITLNLQRGDASSRQKRRREPRQPTKYTQQWRRSSPVAAQRRQRTVMHRLRLGLPACRLGTRSAERCRRGRRSRKGTRCSWTACGWSSRMSTTLLRTRSTCRRWRGSRGSSRRRSRLCSEKGEGGRGWM